MIRSPCYDQNRGELEGKTSPSAADLSGFFV
nr:MAG TPA: hypothetical protein [Caudoviricetes sp.]